jgi:hypothetical protein
MFLPSRVVVLLDGEIKKQDAIPVKTLERVRGYYKAVLSLRRAGRKEGAR